MSSSLTLSKYALVFKLDRQMGDLRRFICFANLALATTEMKETI